MSEKSRYPLLVVGENELFQKCENKFIYYLDTDNLDNYYYDVVINLNYLKIYHGFNMHLIASFQDIDELNTYIKENLKTVIEAIDFDRDLAIEMLGDSEKTFINILNTYLETYDNLETEIIELLSELDFSSIRNLIHKIKGVSLYLGSEKLLKISSEVENKLNNKIATKNDLDFFIKYHNRILNYVRMQVENV